MMSLGLPRRSPALGDQVAQVLRVAILAGELSDGVHLAEEGLARRFGVSRGPARDALRQLEAEGLVQSGRRGCHVVGLSDRDIDEIYSLRHSLEGLALDLAIDRASQADLEQLRELEGRIALAGSRGSPDDLAAGDIAFHSAFYEIADHRRLLQVWQQQVPTFGVLLEVTNALDPDPSLSDAVEGHAALLQAFEERDREHARTLLSSHLRGARQHITRARARRAEGVTPRQTFNIRLSQEWNKEEKS